MMFYNTSHFSILSKYEVVKFSMYVENSSSEKVFYVLIPFTFYLARFKLIYLKSIYECFTWNAVPFLSALSTIY